MASGAFNFCHLRAFHKKWMEHLEYYLTKVKKIQVILISNLTRDSKASFHIFFEFYMQKFH